MKLSIWQQFSSNHSNGFVVVGRFEDVETAKAKADQLRDWLYRMLWGRDYENAKNELLAAYPVQWYENKMNWYSRPDSIDDVIRQFNTDVFIVCPVETPDHHQPFVDLMQKMGPLSVIENHSGHYSVNFLVNITCTAPTEAIAEENYTVIQRYMDQFGEHLYTRNAPMPWAKYSPKFPDNDEQLTIANYDRQEEQWLHDSVAWDQFLKANFFEKDIRQVRYSKDGFLILMRERIFVQDEELHKRISELRYYVTILDGKARLEKNKIFIEQFYCSRPDIFLIAFVQWLESFGCDVTYKLQKKSQL